MLLINVMGKSRILNKGTKGGTADGNCKKNCKRQATEDAEKYNRTKGHDDKNDVDDSQPNSRLLRAKPEK